MNRRIFLAGQLGGAVSSDAFSKTPAGHGAGGPRANYFPNYLLHTHENKPVHFYEDLIRGKIVIVNMMYARCDGICPGMTSNLRKVQKLLGPRVGRDIFMYSLTLQPKHDSPAVLKHYAKMFGAGPGWLFLTGKSSEMEILRRKLGFFDPDPAVDADKTQHTGLVRYGNESLDRWAACPALSNPEQIARAILWTSS